MSIFGKIAEAIFGGPANASEVVRPAVEGSGLPGPQGTGSQGTSPATPSIPTTPITLPTSAPADLKAALPRVDVAAILDKKEDESDEDDLDWRKSIVDLMKLLDLDSSLKSRKALATELAYTGDMNDSAKMNVWLHKQVMTKLAENGGIIPASLKH
jgi:hypothetical protein